MSSKAQQIALDNALVDQENQRVIGKCNMRINPVMKLKESTYQVVLDALALTTCYHDFLITVEVPVKNLMNPQLKRKFYLLSVNLVILEKSSTSLIVQILWGMYYKKNLDFVALIWEDLAYQIDNKDSKKQDKMFYPRFTKIIIHHFLKKDKSISMRNKTFMHTAWDDSLPGTMRFVSRHENAQIYGAILPKAMTNQAMLDSVAYKTYYAITSGAEPSKSKKPKMKSDSAISSKETPSNKKPTKAKKDVPYKKKSASKPKPTKKKALVKADRGKGLNVLLEVALSEAAQLKEATKQRKKDFHISQVSGSGDRTDFESGVPNEQQRNTSGIDEGTDSDDDESNDDNSEEVTNDDDEYDVESDANDDKEANDSEKTNSDEDENLNLNPNDDEEKEKKEEDVCTPDSFEFNDDDEEYDELYKDVNQVIEDAHVTLTSSKKTEGLKQSSSVSSDFASKFLNLDNLSPVINEVASMMNVMTPHEELSTQAPLNLSVPVTAIPETSTIHILPKEISEFATPVIQSTINESLDNVFLAKSSSQLQSTYEAATSLTEFELKKILLDKLKKSKSYRAAEQHRDLYDALVKSYQLDKDLFDSYGKTYSLKRGREDKDKDEDPLAGSDQGLKKRKTSKDAEPSRGSNKSTQAEEPMFETADIEMPQDQRDDLGITKDQPNVEEASKHDWFKKPERPSTPNRDWNTRK
ncbi:hypothetical protein Tco_1206305 [Tanacetum coccineum]